MSRQFLLQLWKEQNNVTGVLVPLLANHVAEISVKIEGVKTPHTGVSLDCLFQGLWSTLALFERSQESKPKPLGHSIFSHRMSWQKVSVCCCETSHQDEQPDGCCLTLQNYQCLLDKLFLGLEFLSWLVVLFWFLVFYSRSQFKLKNKKIQHQNTLRFVISAAAVI